MLIAFGPLTAICSLYPCYQSGFCDIWNEQAVDSQTVITNMTLHDMYMRCDTCYMTQVIPCD